MSHKGLSAILIAVGLVYVLPHSVNADETQNTLRSAVGQSAQYLAQNQTEAAALSLVEGGIDYWMADVGESLPEWVKRFEVETGVNSDGDFNWSVLTVQPLYQSDNLEHTFFTQLSQQRYDYLDLNRDVTNIGLGYRKLFADNTVLLGANTFFDWEWERQHKRAGFGVEAKWYGLDFTGNTYYGLGGASTKGLTGDTREEVLDGYDLELGAQVPYLPWLKVYGSRYVWDSERNNDDIKGWKTSLYADLHQNFSIEAGWQDDNFSEEEVFALVSFRFGFGAEEKGKKPVALSTAFVTDQAWEMRDMSTHTLDKVRRNNRIVVERVSSGVVITRGD
ncbi:MULTISPECIES: inverse autotransporter beta domain-containing protein [Thalassospira]|uniref:Inverse autotransporter beta domain-containing protein n=1 Tax=Thalassospira aquimaris TaxID=3037796 RepID=A0ABT6G6Q0_9PROT|nr:MULTISPECIES: inverse autotransporter beta domain-containing protein [Thalassospira]MDG4717729.1 inverse autotransporter beta domain-containing protein [Thalassospira sp. FZY0004]